MMTHISQSVSVLNITPYGNITNIMNLYDNILIKKYQGLVTCNSRTPLHFTSQHQEARAAGAKLLILRCMTSAKFLLLHL